MTDKGEIKVTDENITAAQAAHPGAVPGRPLEGLRILDLSRAMAGPFCTALLADLGAEIIKVEGLPKGDSTRDWPPFASDGSSLYYLSVNRNKRSVGLDLRTSGAREILGRLVDKTDVLIQNFRPGVLAKMGLDPDRLAVERPDLVIANITAYGSTGPLRDAGGLDQVAQGMSGFMSTTGSADQAPMRAGVPISDITTGMLTAVGIAASLVGKIRSGVGQSVETSLLESTLSMMTFQAQQVISTGVPPVSQGNDHPLITPYGVFEGSDGPFNMAVGSHAQWVTMCELVGAPELATLEEFAGSAARTAHRDQLKAELKPLFAQRTAQEWLGLLRENGIPCGPIYAMDEVFEDEQITAMDVVTRPEDRPDAEPLLRGPVTVGGQRADVYRHPPSLGEQTGEVLAELGYTTTEIRAFIEGGVCSEEREAQEGREDND